MRAAASTQTEGGWRSPLGTAKINSEVAKEILAAAPRKIQDAPSAHQAEHSLEIQLPFLQYIYGPEIEFVPLMISSGVLADFQEVGHAIAEVCKEKNAVLVASTDFTHFESATCAKNKDQKAIDAILNLDEELLYNTVRENKISMCGYGPTSTVIRAAVELGAKEGTLLRYGNSSEVTGDSSDVVAYASLKIIK
jgi:AmmeMemoRadiSam system protein B